MAWVHVPNNIILALHQESGDLTSELNLEAVEALSQSAMWKSKHKPVEFWQRAWKKEPCLQHLSGMIYTPSMAQHGVDLWMESLADIRASRSVVQEEEKDSKIQKTSGQESNNLSLKSNQAGVSLRMWKDTFDSVISTELSQSLKHLASELRHKSAQRLMLVQPINEGASSFSLWLTPTTQEDSNISKRWQEYKGEGKPGKLKNQAENWANGLWPTPVADGDRTVNYKQGGTSLGYKVRHFPQDHMLKKNGKASLKTDLTSRPQLNPRFVEWLMGLPEGWVYHASRNSDYLETE